MSVMRARYPMKVGGSRFEVSCGDAGKNTVHCHVGTPKVAVSVALPESKMSEINVWPPIVPRQAVCRYRSLLLLLEINVQFSGVDMEPCQYRHTRAGGIVDLASSSKSSGTSRAIRERTSGGNLLTNYITFRKEGANLKKSYSFRGL